MRWTSGQLRCADENFQCAYLLERDSFGVPVDDIMRLILFWPDCQRDEHVRNNARIHSRVEEAIEVGKQSICQLVAHAL